MGCAFDATNFSACAGGGKLEDHASLRLPPFEPLIWLKVVYRHAWTFPLSDSQSAPAGADSWAGVKAGIAAALFEPPPDAPTAVNRTNETAVPKASSRTSLFIKFTPL